VSSREVERTWRASLSRAAKAAGAASGQARGWVAVVVEPYFVAGSSTLAARPDSDGRWRVHWEVGVKPFDVDPLLWEVMGPADMGTPAKQVGLRVIGAFSLERIPLARSVYHFAPDSDEVDEAAASCVKVLEDEAADFLQQRPTLSDFLAAIEHAERESAVENPRYALLATLTAIRSGELSLAERMIAGALARGERQFSTPRATVWELFERDRRAGTGVFAPSASIAKP
jgi:hypothetical protein